MRRKSIFSIIISSLFHLIGIKDYLNAFLNSFEELDFIDFFSILFQDFSCCIWILHVLNFVLKKPNGLSSKRISSNSWIRFLQSSLIWKDTSSNLHLAILEIDCSSAKLIFCSKLSFNSSLLFDFLNLGLKFCIGFDAIIANSYLNNFLNLWILRLLHFFSMIVRYNFRVHCLRSWSWIKAFHLFRTFRFEFLNCISILKCIVDFLNLATPVTENISTNSAMMASSKHSKSYIASIALSYCIVSHPMIFNRS